MTCGSACADLNVDPAHCGACDTACGPDQVCSAGACATPVWEQLMATPYFLMLPDYIPAGATTIYAQGNGDVCSYALPNDTAPLGVWAAGSAASPSLDSYSTQVLVGTTYYELDGISMYTYDPASKTWSTPLNNSLTHALGDAENTVDDSGNVYAWSKDQYLVKVHATDTAASYFQGPTDLTTGEPRAAWDSQTKRVYLGDYSDTSDTFYSFDPATSTFTKLANFPDPMGLSDAFCSDHQGHIFTANSDCYSSSDMWMYTAATDTWTQLPWLPWRHGCNASCSVSADGYLYLTNGDDDFVARLKL
jgi:hypothetical protein